MRLLSSSQPHMAAKVCRGLRELEAAALTVDHPMTDDVVLRTENGAPLLAVSRRLVDRLGGQAELVVGLSETGEPSFRLVRKSIAN